MPPRAPSAEPAAVTAPEAIAAAIQSFIAGHPGASVLEGGKAIFHLATAKHTVTTTSDRCSLQIWDDTTNIARTIVSAEPRRGSLRLMASRLGQAHPRVLELSARIERPEPTSRGKVRQQFLTLIERVLQRSFDGWTPEGFRASMDLERSFGPAYARGLQTRGREAWAVIAIGSSESMATIEGILTIGILWLEECRSRGDGRRIVKGLRVIVPRGRALVTQSRMRWLNAESARWELFELDEPNETLLERDPEDVGNIRTHLTHRPDETSARDRFSEAIARLHALLPAAQTDRVEMVLRSPAELSFQLHGLEFACARFEHVPGRFTHNVQLIVGAGSEAQVLEDGNRERLKDLLADLFTRRRAGSTTERGWRVSHQRGIGDSAQLAHTRMGANRLRVRSSSSANDPLYRAAPERWLESVLRRDLAPLTRGLALSTNVTKERQTLDANDDDNFGNRLETPEAPIHQAARSAIPRLDSRFVYTQVAATAGASDRGLLDLLGVTTDGRLAVIELKANEDLQFALQGLDYWLRMREHHRDEGALQRHGYFRNVVLSSQPPRLYLVAPALRIHPATETVLRHFASEVEWQLIALDERWREHIRVVWRKSSKTL